MLNETKVNSSTEGHGEAQSVVPLAQLVIKTVGSTGEREIAKSTAETTAERTAERTAESISASYLHHRPFPPSLVPKSKLFLS